MSTFHLQIVTPDGAFYDGEAESLVVHAIDGDVCIMANHIPYVTALGTGEARVTVNGEKRRAAASGGMLTVSSERVRLVATTFEWAEDIDAARAQRARAAAEERLQNARDAAEIQLAKAKLTRALVRIKVAQ